jgi:hypothetical protein
MGLLPEELLAASPEFSEVELLPAATERMVSTDSLLKIRVVVLPNH